AAVAPVMNPLRLTVFWVMILPSSNYLFERHFYRTKSTAPERILYHYRNWGNCVLRYPILG
ncbi:MAG: hypothetical protein RR619_09850, partial [Raoultibacter sp.]